MVYYGDLRSFLATVPIAVLEKTSIGRAEVHVFVVATGNCTLKE